jgi:DNA processing protein
VPFAVFVRGLLPLDAPAVAVVGTRRMTDYGRRAARLIVTELAQAGITIVSGLALGVDAEAHEACLAAGGRTVAILPGGVDDASVAPPRNRPLADQILAADGALLSEHPPGYPIREFSFLHRNRHIAALASAVVIPEADRDSGALVTARLALESGRDVLAVPGPIWSRSSRGTNWLISQGARPCCSAEDIFASLGFRDPEQAKHMSAARASIPVEPEEQPVLDALEAPHTPDEVARLLNQPIARISALMTVLELKGRIISVGPRTFVIAP